MRILFLTHTHIGDATLSTILLNRMLHAHPDAVVDVACGAKAIDLFKGLPNLGVLFPVIKKKKHAHHIDIWKQFRKNKYDYVVDLRGSLMPVFLKKKKIIRFSNNNRKIHKAQQLADLFPSDLPVMQKVWLDESIVAPIEKITTEIKSKGPLIGIGPASNWRAKTWPQRKFAILVAEILQLPGFENAKFALFGSPNERESVSDLLDYIPEDRLIDLVGGTSLAEATAWMQGLDIFIGHDSGLSHLAAAVNVPTITLFGPTPDNLYAPVTDKGVIISPEPVKDVNLRADAPKRLITDISPEDVLQAFKEIFIEEPATNAEQEEKKESISA